MVKRATLTDEKIAKLNPASAGQRYHVYDADEAVPGFGVRVTDRGPVSFILYTRFSPGSPPARTTLGKVGPMKVGQARSKAEQWLSMLEAGLDPRAEEREAREAARKAKAGAKKERRDVTFAGAAQAYMEHKRRAGHRRADVAEREINRHLVTRWGKKLVSEVRRSDVVGMVEDLTEQGKARTAHDMFAHARAIFSWAIDKGWYGLEHSPCDRMKPSRLIGAKKIRMRVLTDEELLAYWRVSRRLGYPLGSFYRVLLLTGQRVSEVAGMRWRELHPEIAKLLRNSELVDWAKIPAAIKVWTIPPERFKSNSSHIVPLSDAVCRELASLPLFRGGDYVFTSTFGKKPINGFANAKARLDNGMVLTLRAIARQNREDTSTVDLAPWVQHDVRRTVRTRLSGLRVPADVAEMVVGHSKQGLKRVYDQHEFVEEMREALEAWAQQVESIVEPKASNVVALPVRRAT